MNVYDGDQVLTEFGRVILLAQSIEMDLVSFGLLDSLSAISSTSEEEIREGLKDLEADLEGRTFGRVLNRLSSSPALTPELNSLLREVLQLRNRLVHFFFKEHDILTEEGRERMMKDLEASIETLYRCSRLVKRRVQSFMAELGIPKQLLDEECKKLGVPPISEDSESIGSPNKGIKRKFKSSCF